MDKARKALDWVSEKLSILIIAVMVVLVTWQVVTRYIFSSPVPWSEQLSKYLFVWLVLINGAYMFGKHGHMKVAFFQELLPQKIQRWLNIFIELVVIMFALAVLLYGGVMALRLGIAQTDAALGISMGYVYAALPLSGIITTLYGFIHLINAAKEGNQ